MKFTLKKTITVATFLILTILPFNLEALIKQGKLWVGLNVQKTLGKESKWMASLFSQLRFTDQPHHFRVFFIESGIGYQYTKNSIWFGYRWSKHIPRRSFQQNRLFQQFILRPEKKNENYSCSFRTRLEEIQHSNHKQVAVRIRQRNNIEILNRFKNRIFFFDKINPLIYDELFITLNKSHFTSHRLISENRLFFGFNLYVDKNAWWEAGYIMQYRSKLPFSRQNQLNHVISINYFYK